jgi:GAF domain-containing protein
LSRPLDVVAALTRVSHDLGSRDDLAAALSSLVAEAHDAMPGVDRVSVTVRVGSDSPRIVASTGEQPDDGPDPAELGMPFRADDQTVGSLDLQAASPAAFSDEVREIGGLFAAHVGLAVRHARRVENLTAALHSRKTIGLALGMVMQRLDLDEDAAFAYLTRISATSETKLRDVAADVVQQHRDRLAR